MLKKIKAMEPSEPSAGVVQLTRLDLYWAGLAFCKRERHSATVSRGFCQSRKQSHMDRIGARHDLRKQAGKKKKKGVWEGGAESGTQLYKESKVTALNIPLSFAFSCLSLTNEDLQLP